MKQTLHLFGIIALTSVLFSACNHSQTEQPGKSNTENEIRAANDQFYTALNAMFVGKMDPMNDSWSHGDDVTLLGPFGDRLVGWEAVGAEFKRESEMKLGGKVVCKDLKVVSGAQMGYTVCVEEGENMNADGKPVLVKFRATNIFRLEKGEWKLVHHHTDLSTPLQEAYANEKK